MVYNEVYVGLSSTFSIVVEAMSCGDFDVYLDSVKMQAAERCEFEIPSQPIGSFTISVRLKGSTDTIAKRTIRVLPIPKPIALIGNLNPGGVNSTTFKAQLGVVAFYSALPICGSFKVSDFHFVAFRGSQVLFSYKNAGPKFESDLKDKMKMLQPADVVVISNIKYSDYSGSIKDCAPIEYVLTK